MVKAQASSSTTLAVNPNPATVNQEITLTATVTGNSPTGTVTFKDGATTLGTAALSAGKATYTTSFASAGSRSLTASYGGDAGNESSASEAVALTVKAKPLSSAVLSVILSILNDD